MKCAVHPDVDATGYCRQCGKPLCPQCARDVRGALYCEECLSSLVFGASGSHPPVARPTTSKPGAALFLGFVPGLGAVYNGEYVKALIHVCIFGGLIAAINSDIPNGFDALFGVALACFYFYMPIDAYRVAKARETGQPVPDALALPITGNDGRVPLGPIILIGLGALLLFANFGLFRWDWFWRFWPLGLIALGAWILIGRTKQNS
jgi:Domain of unknown function (DUF5668)/B-box zinc finger